MRGSDSSASFVAEKIAERIQGTGREEGVLGCRCIACTWHQTNSNARVFTVDNEEKCTERGCIHDHIN